MEECIAIVYYHSFPSALMFILILCKDYGYLSIISILFSSAEVSLSAHYT